MGQYFRAVNVSKAEYVDPWDIGGFAKLSEWCANVDQAGIFPYLLRTSSGSGGGDVHTRIAHPKFAGRWAGDVVHLVGDYDETGLFASAEAHYRNISKPLMREYRRFMDLA
jgi:hypothetical protein